MNNFLKFPKMARYSRECIVTEKIDGTNAQIYITEDGGFFVGFVCLNTIRRLFKGCKQRGICFPR